MSPHYTLFPQEGTPGSDLQPLSSHEGYPGPNSGTFGIHQAPGTEAHPRSYSAATLYTDASQAAPTKECSHTVDNRMEVERNAVQKLKAAGIRP
jgi:hypothetical protein